MGSEAGRERKKGHNSPTLRSVEQNTRWKLTRTRVDFAREMTAAPHGHAFQPFCVRPASSVCQLVVVKYLLRG